MLVLTRRAGESIVIGDDVRVVVLDVRGDTVRLGIEAPRSVQVHRAEVYAEVQAANAAAANTGDDLGAVAERLHRLARPRPAGRGPARPSSGSPSTSAPSTSAPSTPGPPVPAATPSGPSPSRPAVPRPGPPSPG